MSSLCINLPDDIVVKFKIKLLEKGFSQKIFWEKTVKEFVSEGDIFLVPDYFIEELGGDKKSAQQKLFAWIHAYVENEKKKREAGSHF